jgi:hypothetical protein
VLHVLPVSSSLTWSFKLCLGRSTTYEAPHMQFSPISCHFISSDQIFLSAPSSQTPSVYVH